MEAEDISDKDIGDKRRFLRTVSEQRHITNQPSLNATGDMNISRSALLKVKIEPCDVPMEPDNYGDQWYSAGPDNEQTWNDWDPVSMVEFSAEEHVPVKAETVDELLGKGQMIDEQEELRSFVQDDIAIESKVEELPGKDEIYSLLIDKCGFPVIEEALNPLPDLLQLGQRVCCNFCGMQQMYGANYREHTGRCIERVRNLVCQCCGTTWLKLKKPLRCVKRNLLASGKESYLFCYTCPHEFRQQPSERAKAKLLAKAERFAGRIKDVIHKKKLPTSRDKQAALKHLHLLRGKLLCQRDGRDPIDKNIAAMCNALEEGISKLGGHTSLPRSRPNITMSDCINPSNGLTSIIDSRVMGSCPVLQEPLKRKPVMSDHRSDSVSFYKHAAIGRLRPREVLKKKPRLPIPVKAIEEKFRESITHRWKDVLSRKRQLTNRQLEVKAIRVGTIKRCTVLLERLPQVANNNRVRMEEDNEFVVPCDDGGLKFDYKSRWMDGYFRSRNSNESHSELEEKQRRESLVAQRQLADMGKLVTPSGSTWNSFPSAKQKKKVQPGSSRNPLAAEAKRKAVDEYVELATMQSNVKWTSSSYPNSKLRDFAKRLPVAYHTKKCTVDKALAAGKLSFDGLNLSNPHVPTDDVAVTMELILYALESVHFWIDQPGSLMPRQLRASPHPLKSSRKLRKRRPAAGSGEDNQLAVSKLVGRRGRKCLLPTGGGDTNDPHTVPKVMGRKRRKFSFDILKKSSRLYLAYHFEDSLVAERVLLNSEISHGGRVTAFGTEIICDLPCEDVENEVRIKLKIMVNAVARVYKRTPRVKR